MVCQMISITYISYVYDHYSIDHSLFLKHDGNYTTALLIYVDDIVLKRNDYEEITRITNILDQNSHIKNFGNFTYFLVLK